MQDEVTVTQIDREAAYGAYFECYDTAPNDLWLQAMLEGRHDEDSLIQVLARHRHQAERETLARMEPVAERYRHKKRGTVYEVIGTAELQVAGLAPDEGDYLEVYRGDDGKLWARPFDEFHDGRFEALPPAPEAGQ